MPDLPEINAGVGNDALDKTIEADRQATANAARAERKLAEQRLSRAQKKAQIEASGVSASEFASSGDAWGSGPLVTDFAKKLQSDMEVREHNKRNANASLEEEANRVAADFANDQAVQRDKEREAAESAEQMSKAFNTTTHVATVMVSAMGSVAQAMNDLAKNRAEGAKIVGDTRQSIAESVQAMGGNNANEIIERAEKGGFGVGVTPQDVAKLLSNRASYARANPLAPALLDEALDVIADAGAQHRSMDDAAAVLSQPFPGVARKLQDATRGGVGTPGNVRAYRGGNSGRETAVYQAQAGKFREGVDRMNEEGTVRQMAVEDTIGAAAAKTYGLFGNVVNEVKEYFSEQEAKGREYYAERRHQEQLKELRKMNSNAVPPTTGGR